MADSAGYRKAFCRCGVGKDGEIGEPAWLEVGKVLAGECERGERGVAGPRCAKRQPDPQDSGTGPDDREDFSRRQARERRQAMRSSKSGARRGR